MSHTFSHIRDRLSPQLDPDAIIDSNLKVALLCRSACVLIAAVALLNYLGVFLVSSTLYPVLLIAILVMLLPTLFYNVLKIRSVAVRYFTLTLIVLLSGLLYAFFSYHVVMLLVLPVIISCLYCDYRFTLYTSAISIPVMIAAHFVALKLQIIPDEPVVTLHGLFHALLPRIMEFIFLSITCTAITRKIQRLIHSLTAQNKTVQQQADELQRNQSRLQAMSAQTIESLAYAIDARDEYASGHSSRVAAYSALLAESLGWDAQAIANLQYSALLHDIGKIGIPDSILSKPGVLTEAEYETVKAHTVMGADILKNISPLETAEAIARHHHECYDGSGYPDHLKGAEIPIEARLVHIADAYDAMSSRRTYRTRMPRELIREELIRGRGTQFDPDLLDAFLKLFDENKLEQAAFAAPPTIPTEVIHDSSGQLLQKFIETMSETRQPASQDGLTGLMLRSDGERQIAEAMAETPGCLVFIDVDNLKRINDTLGHRYGDKVLSHVGVLLKEQPEGTIAFRLGGDEFLCFMPNVTHAEAEARISALIQRFLDEREITLWAASISAGLCFSTPEDSYADIYSNADKALYYVKQNGKSGYYFYQNAPLRSADSNVDLDQLVSSLRSSGSYSGALDVEYREFAKLYEYVRNLEKRYHHGFSLILLTVQDVSAHPLTIEDMETVMATMESVIRKAIRNVDIYTRYSGIQFLIILLGAGDEHAHLVIDRIQNGFSNTRPQADIQLNYATAKLEETAES